MKKFLLLIHIMFPAMTWAQAVNMLTRKASSHKATTPLSLEQAIMGMANPRVLELASKTVLYKHLSDTISNQNIIQLNTGEYVVVWNVRPRWLKVYRAKSPTQFSADTTTYYMPKTATKGAKTFIML